MVADDLLTKSARTVTFFQPQGMAQRPHDKAGLRAWARELRGGLDGASRAAATGRVVTRIDTEILSRLPVGGSIGLYAATRNELAADGLAEVAHRRGFSVAYPRVVAGARQLQFRRALPATLESGTFGIFEPADSAPVVSLDELVAIFVPGLLFDRSGRRLGWGGGYYDATLPMTSALRIGLAYEPQLVDELPTAAHDQSVHLIATDRALYVGALGHPLWIS